jgi:NhaP-type Na+/H+ or K+/H+ antiporter
MHHFYEIISYIANKMIFIFCGVICGDSEDLHNLPWADWGYLTVLYIFLTFARAGIVFGFRTCFKCSCVDVELDWKSSLVVVWGGLRGAVGLAMALSLQGAKWSCDVDEDDECRNSFESRALFFAAGIVGVFLSLLMLLIFWLFS